MVWSPSSVYLVRTFDHIFQQQQVPVIHAEKLRMCVNIRVFPCR